MKILVIAALLSPCLIGQTTAPKYKFEVASVKSVGDQPERITTPGGFTAMSTGAIPELKGDPAHLQYSSLTLFGILMRAYDVTPRLIECPDWMKRERYTLEANVPDNAPKGHIPEMLQNLLADRFHMVVHWDSKEQSGYALTVGKTGLKLKSSELKDDGTPKVRNAGMGGVGHRSWNGETMDQFADALCGLMGQPVVNQTGSTGYFDIAFDAAPDSMPGASGGTQRPDSPNPPLAAVLRDLGFNLQPLKVTVKRLVVDSAVKSPTEN